MRNVRIVMMSLMVVFAGFPGCASPGTGSGSADGIAEKQSASRLSRQPRVVLTARNNPTTLAGRGEPSLDDFDRPAAWVYIDGQSGTFIERDGHPQVQWVIDGPIGSSPTFRVEAYEPLLGKPSDFNCVLKTVESADGSEVLYAFTAEPGTFRVGREYSLLEPGKSFTIRNNMTGDVVNEIPALMPGTYMMAAGVKNLEASTEGLAITYFTVGEGQ